jgi:uncharacterized membrane protein YbhN (UPF0104 family)
MSTPDTTTNAPAQLVARFRHWVAWAVAGAALLYVAGSLWVGFREVGAALADFRWSLFVPVLLLTLVNYGLRFWKWDYLLRRLGVAIRWQDNLTAFVAGLAMVLSPGKAGEVLKPWLVRARTGAPLAQTVPALVTERLTDGLAVLGLAAISVGRYGGDRQIYVWGPIAAVLVGLGILASRSLSMAILGVTGRVPGLARFTPKLVEMYLSMRTCLSPVALAWTMLASFVAWFAECIGYWLVFRGFELAATPSLEGSTFLYAFATVAGGAMPGGLGMADGALVGGAMNLFAVPKAEAVAAALLIRVATLWLGVVMGAFALLRVGTLLERSDHVPGGPEGGGGTPAQDTSG